MRRTPIYLLLAFSILCMSTSSIIIRYSLAPAMIIALYRAVFTSAMAAGLESADLRTNCKSMSGRDFLLITGAGFFLALHFAFWISSLSFTSISSSVLFTNLQVIFVLIFSILVLREQINAWIVGGIITAIAGSVLIAGGDMASGKLMGDMLALASGFFVAIYFIIGRQVRVRVTVWTYTALVFAAAAVVLLISSYFMGLNLIDYPLHEWVYFILLALGPGIAGHGILNWSLKYLKAPVVAVSILGESVGASILAWVIFNEVLFWYQIIGGLLILGGIYAAATHEKEA